MFEDLIRSRRQGKYIENANPNICPYCESFSVTQYEIRELSTETYERIAKCNICHKEWHIIYDRYMISATIVF
ncbi:hypothetical protein LCGC14_1451080 [marine sediment metagenome]|uniref:Uncharacterized protein n=1 Tax=marine sediment metagenome TaxID=412755 RepID=A0A0F9LYI7_9ZZZZ